MTFVIKFSRKLNYYYFSFQPGVVLWVILYLRGWYHWPSIAKSFNQWDSLSECLTSFTNRNSQYDPWMNGLAGWTNLKNNLFYFFQFIANYNCFSKYEMKYWCFLFCYQNYRWKFNYTINTVLPDILAIMISVNYFELLNLIENIKLIIDVVGSSEVISSELTD